MHISANNLPVLLPCPPPPPPLSVGAQKPDDPAAQSQWILKFLPFMVGYFSLNVPSGLGVYWIVNNLVTTVTTYVARLPPT